MPVFYLTISDINPDVYECIIPDVHECINPDVHECKNPNVHECITQVQIYKCSHSDATLATRGL